MSAPYAAMDTADLVALRGRLARSYLDHQAGGATVPPTVRQLSGVEAVLTTRQTVRALSEAQQAARWVEVLAEHEPKRAADFAALVERAAEGVLTLAAEIRVGCTTAAEEGERNINHGEAA